MQTAFDSVEAQRESEFGFMKELIKKLVFALEDKASSDLISLSGPRVMD